MALMFWLIFNAHFKVRYMKQRLLLAAVVLSLGSAFAQENTNDLLTGQKPSSYGEVESRTSKLVVYSSGSQRPEAPFYTEDFANGLPTGWVIEVGSGLDPDGVWTYRGPATTPNVTTGSQGAYAGTRGPIQSPSASNGFFIMDSDFLDNAGIVGNFGGGIAASPHTTHLVSDVLNLIGQTEVDFTFNQYYRRFAGPGGSQAVVATYIDFSIDGGATWPYTLTVNTNVSVNNETTANDQKSFPIGQWVGNQSNVKFRFRFDGDYYFWMIDDIAMDATPKYRAEFTSWRGAPERDVIFGPAQGSVTMGTQTNKQKRPVEFDCNIVSTGSAALYNAQLFVDIYNNGALVTSLSSTPHNSFIGGIKGDSLGFDTLNTYNSPWTPAGLGDYDFRFRVEADSTAVGGNVLTLISDTSTLSITDSVNAQDFGVFWNSLGTDQLGDDLSAIAARLDWVGPERLFAVEMVLSSLTVAGGQIELTVYDSAAFIDFTTGFIPGSALTTQIKTVSAQDVATGRIRFDVTDANGRPLSLNSGAHYFVATMFSNAGANLIRLGNDQSFGQRAGGTLMYVVDQARWFTGYSNSRTLNCPMIRAITCPDATCQNFPFSTAELSLNGLSIYPNPATDHVVIEMEGEAGIWDIRLFDMGGREVVFAEWNKSTGAQAERLSTAALAKGLYVLEISHNGRSYRQKLTVE